MQTRRLPPGEYQAVWARGEQYSNGGWVRKPLAPGPRFTVKTGEPVYIGRYVVDQDEYLSIAKAKQPVLPADAVTSQVPPAGQRRF